MTGFPVLDLEAYCRPLTRDDLKWRVNTPTRAGLAAPDGTDYQREVVLAPGTMLRWAKLHFSDDDFEVMRYGATPREFVHVFEILDGTLTGERAEIQIL